MCNAYCVLFAALNLKREDVQGKEVIEVGSKDVNGSVRKLVESYKPKHYLGVDICAGQGVDVVCNADDLLRDFQKASFDVLISTEMLEHARNWKKAISNFKNIVRPGGIIFITTRSLGFPYHEYPYDFWRYEIEDIQNIFSDCMIERVEKDPEKGVFAKIRKPDNFVENDLSSYELYSVIVDKRIRQLNAQDLYAFLTHRERNRRLRLVRERLNPLRLIVPEQIPAT
jgi:SAM-dependent methyltransferase